MHHPLVFYSSKMPLPSALPAPPGRPFNMWISLKWFRHVRFLLIVNICASLGSISKSPWYCSNGKVLLLVRQISVWKSVGSWAISHRRDKTACIRIHLCIYIVYIDTNALRPFMLLSPAVNSLDGKSKEAMELPGSRKGTDLRWKNIGKQVSCGPET